MQFKCGLCETYLTNAELLEAVTVGIDCAECPSCKQSGHIETRTVAIHYVSELKPLIDIAMNFGMLLQAGECLNYGDFDYYEEIVKLTEKFLNTPQDNRDSLYLEEIDKFSVTELRKKFGGGNEV